VKSLDITSLSGPSAKVDLFRLASATLNQLHTIFLTVSLHKIQIYLPPIISWLLKFLTSPFCKTVTFADDAGICTLNACFLSGWFTKPFISLLHFMIQLKSLVKLLKFSTQSSIMYNQVISVQNVHQVNSLLRHRDLVDCALTHSSSRSLKHLKTIRDI